MLSWGPRGRSWCLLPRVGFWGLRVTYKPLQVPSSDLPFPDGWHREHLTFFFYIFSILAQFSQSPSVLLLEPGCAWQFPCGSPGRGVVLQGASARQRGRLGPHSPTGLPPEPCLLCRAGRSETLWAPERLCQLIISWDSVS